MKARIGPDPEVLKGALDTYEIDVESGVFVHKITRGRAKAGDIPKNVHPTGYETIHIGRRNYLKHRVVWLVVYGEWPSGALDHRDGDKTNNGIGNLRLATPSQNQYNKLASPNSQTGVKGVRRRPGDRYEASIRTPFGRLYLGLFKTVKEAAAAYASAAQQHHGEFCRLDGRPN